MKSVLYFILSFLLLIVGCNVNDLDFKNLEGPTLTSNSGIPIGNVTYTMRELIEKVNDDQLDLQEDSSSLLFLIYRDTADFNTGTDIIDIGDVNQSVFFTLPATVPTGKDTTVSISQTFELVFQPTENEELTEVFYSDGQLQFIVNPNLNFDHTYTASFQNTLEVANDNPLVITETSPESNSLIGYKSVFTFTNDSNRFQLDFDFSINLGPTEFIPANTDVILDINYLNQEFSLLYGKFGQDTINVGGQVLQVDFFEDLGDEGFVFGNPTFSFDFVNSFGLPLGLTFEGMYGVEGTGAASDTTYLTGEVTQTPQLVSGAENLGESVSSTIVLNSDNSSIRTLLERSPNQIGFDLTAIANPEDITALNFIENTSEITTYIEAILPLDVQLNDVTRDIDFSLGGGLNFSQADSLSLRVVSINEIPFSILLDLEIYDENDSILFVVAESKPVETPFLNLDGSLKQARKQIEDIPIDSTGIVALNDGNRINLKVTINTPESRNSEDIFVKILADYKLEIQLSAIGTLEVDL